MSASLGVPYRAWVAARLPRFAGPSRPSLAPRKPRPCTPIGLTLRQTIPRASPDTRRRLAVAPLIGDKRCYGESPARPRRDYGGRTALLRGISTCGRGKQGHYTENSEEG